MIKKFFREFADFAMRGNLVDLAVGFTVGAAFTAIARSLVDDIIMPFVGYLIGDSEMADRFWVLEPGTTAGPYQTLAAAQEAGAITINYGIFLNSLLTFVIVALTMYFIIRSINRVENMIEDELGMDEDVQPTTRKCPYCISTISRKAQRCPNCTSQLEPKTVGAGAS